MTTYARIAGGLIAEIITPPSAFDGIPLDQQFPEFIVATLVDVTSASPQPQPGWTASQSGSTWTFTAPVVVAPTQTPSQQAIAAQSNGLAITATTTALNGTYDVSQTSRINIMAQEISVSVTGTFTNGQSTINWPDMNGSLHSFTVAQFKAFATAVGFYYTELFFIQQSNSGSLPAATATIAV